MKNMLLMVFNILLTLTGVESSVDFKVTHWTKCPKWSRHFRKFVGVSVEQCVDECTRRPSCRSVGYTRRVTLCEVHLEDTTFEEDTTDDDGSCIFIKKDHMTRKGGEMIREDMEGHVYDVSTGTYHKECDAFNLSHGKVYGDRRYSGAKVAFKCDAGYHEKTGEKNAICEHTGEWSYTPECESTVSVTMASQITSTHSSRSETTPRTNAETETISSATTTTSTGTISSVCLDPPNLEYAILQPGVVTQGVVRTYKFDCPAGMIGYGVPEVTCLSNLTWSQADISCRDIRNCSDVKRCDNSYDDGEYWLFPENLGNKKFKIFCAGMGDAAPSEYITVDENENYGFDAGETASGGLLTRYKKIRVNIKTLEIIRADHRYTDPSSSTFDYAQGRSCRCSPRCNFIRGYFNISTEGTGFKFDKQVTWVPVGWNATMAEFDRNEDSTIISARCGGNCGICKPDGPLYVELDESTVLDDETATLPKCN